LSLVVEYLRIYDVIKFLLSAIRLVLIYTSTSLINNRDIIHCVEV